MKFVFGFLIFALAVCGCTTASHSRLAAQNAFLAGQNSALRQQVAAQFNGVTIIGAVQNSQVAWVAGLTLAQAVATANFIGADEPKHIIITHQGESATLGADVLFGDTDIPLEPGDIVELR